MESSSAITRPDATPTDADNWKLHFLVAARHDPSFKLGLAEYWSLKPKARAEASSAQEVATPESTISTVMSRIARSRSASRSAISRRRESLPGNGTSCSAAISTKLKSDSSNVSSLNFSLW